MIGYFKIVSFDIWKGITYWQGLLSSPMHSTLLKSESSESMRFIKQRLQQYRKCFCLHVLSMNYTLKYYIDLYCVW